MGGKKTHLPAVRQANVSPGGQVLIFEFSILLPFHFVSGK